jgi:anaerobic magnesium-protoporphyrin IX monomethyl ester cyclase
MNATDKGPAKRIAYIQTVPFELVGIQMLAAVLPQHDNQVFITYIDTYQKLLAKLSKFKPDIICFTACTGDHEGLLATAAKLKDKFDVPFIWGGPHPTFFPDLIDQKGVDVVVRGEGERLLPRLVESPADTTVESCWFKQADGTIIKNPMGRLIRNLDELPFPDKSLYRKSYKSLPYSSLTVLAGRGCPFNCTFCYNQMLKDLFSQDLKSGGYVRLRSPENVIAEIEAYVAEYGRPRYVHFRDDTFIFNRKWLDKFLPLYKEKVGIPFTAFGRADLVDEKLCASMKDAGLEMFYFAVESGSERLRNEICDKRIMDEQIISCGDLLNKYKIPFRVFNMMGLPTETYEDTRLTVKINQRIRNRYPLATVYEPYVGTRLEEIAREGGMLVDVPRRSWTQYDNAYVKVDPRTMRIHKLFFWLVMFPGLNPMLYRWIEKDHTALNKVLFYIGYAYVLQSTYKYTLGEMVALVARLFKPLVTFKH